MAAVRLIDYRIPFLSVIYSGQGKRSVYLLYCILNLKRGDSDRIIKRESAEIFMLLSATENVLFSRFLIG